MEYISIREISNKWGLTERRVTALCRDGRIPGVKKSGNEWLVPSDAIKPLDKRTKEFEAEYKEEKTLTSYTSTGSSERIIECFKSKYNRDPMGVMFTPYRVCFLGAHTDHNSGKTIGFAIDKGLHIAYSVKNNGIIELESLQFPKRAQWHVLETPREKEEDWADPLRGATIALNKRFPLRYGLCAVIDGELPIGGLSSSSALIISFIHSLAFINNITLTNDDIIDIVSEAEREYLGMENGLFDQVCELYAKKNHLLYMDMLDESYNLIVTPKNMKSYDIVIFFSGIDKNITPEFYNIRVDELRSSAYMLKALSNMEYGKYIDTNMRDIPYDVFSKYKGKLPNNYLKRSTHWYEELQRVEDGISAYINGDIDRFGQLVNESGQSSIDNWETGSEELINLYKIIKNTKGVYGTRFAGSGFKGCCIALVNPDEEESILNNVCSEYLKLYPRLVSKYSAHICHTADGIKM